MTQVKNFHIFVEGRVQGVGYRRFVFARAQKLGLKGWVRNLLDGRVEIQVSFPAGMSEEEFFEELRKGPAFSKVRELKVETLLHDLVQEFAILPDEDLNSNRRSQ